MVTPIRSCLHRLTLEVDNAGHNRRSRKWSDTMDSPLALHSPMSAKLMQCPRGHTGVVIVNANGFLIAKVKVLGYWLGELSALRTCS